MALLTAAELQDAVNISSTEATEFASVLADKLAATEEAIDFLCGPTTARAVVKTVSGSGLLVLPTVPVLSLTSVVGDYWGALDVSKLTSDPDSGVIRPKTGYRILPDTYVVTFQAGRATVPASIKEAAAIIVRHLWDTRRGPNRRTNQETTIVEGLGYALPNRALQMLAGVRRGPGS